VRKVGAHRFGILAVDSSKRRFAVMLTDFLGNLLWGVHKVEKTGPALAAFVERLKQEVRSRKLKGLVVGLERTGRYHVPMLEVLKPHWPVEMVDPFATKQLRQPAHPNHKTDETDLVAIVGAIRMGFGTREAELAPAWLDWRLESRSREDYVRMRALARQHIQEKLEALLPGFAGLFADLWQAPTALRLAEHYGSAAALLAEGADAARAWLRGQGHQARRQTLERILAWARTAASPDPGAAVRHALLRRDLEHERFLGRVILASECTLAGYLVDTPFVLLLSVPGIHVVSSASYAAELGPIEQYINPEKISGRAGLYPSRYQSDEVDYADGPLVGHRNARLRDAIHEVAYCLATCNPYFKAWAEVRRTRGWPDKKIHIALAKTFIRISYRMLAGRQVFDHPCAGARSAILRKLYEFAASHDLTPELTRDLLVRAAAQIPRHVLPEEARELEAKLPRRRRRHRPTGPEHISTILPHVLRHLARGLPIREERREPGTREVTGGLLIRQSAH
jgi:transposase